MQMVMGNEYDITYSYSEVVLPALDNIAQLLQTIISELLLVTESDVSES